MEPVVTAEPTPPESLLAEPPEPAAETEPKAEELKVEAPPAFEIDKLELPEGFTLPDEVKTELSAIAEKHALSGPAAQELLSLHAKLVQDQSRAMTQAWYDTQKEWVGAVKADPEFAGEKLVQAQAVIAQALGEYGTPEVRAAMDLTGAGNNPHVFKFFYNMAKALSEGKAAAGGAPAVTAPRSLAETIYGSKG